MNTSADADIYRIEFGIEGMNAIDVRITPGNSSELTTPLVPGITREALLSTMRIYTVRRIGPPTDTKQCKNGGWREFNVPSTFKNQGACIRYVESQR